MKKIILLLLVTLCINYSHAQTNNRDSLKQLLQKEKTDTGRVSILNELSYSYLLSKPETTMSLALEALSLASHTGFVKGQAASLNMIGNAFTILGNYPKAMESYLRALRINEKINTGGIAGNLGNIGLIYFQEEDYRHALNYLLKAKDLEEKDNKGNLFSLTLATIAQTYEQLKIYDSATFYAQQSYDAAYKLNDPMTIGISLSVLGTIHLDGGQNALALDYFRLSIPNSKKAKADITLSRSFLGIAKVFEKTGQNDSALLYAKQAFSIDEEKKFPRQLVDASSFLSSFYKNKHNADSALYYMEVAKSANDSLFSQQKQSQLQSLFFDEKLRQQEIATAELKAKEERKNNLQYAAIAIGIITFIILFFLLSRTIIVKTKFIEFFSVLGLLAVFEFINLYIHPFLADLTNDSPVLMLLILIAIGAMLVPLHHKLEKWITKVMVEKNKKIRLDAAKETIANIGGEQTK